MGIRNPAWVRDELILALDLYFRHNPLHISENHDEVVALSNLLRRLPIHADTAESKTFRNPSGVYMKLCNFLRLDPSYPGKGLDAGSKLDEAVWNEFSGNREHLQAVAAAIREIVLQASQPHHTDQSPPEVAVKESADGEELYPEGKIVYRLHHFRECNRPLVRKRKTQAIERYGELRCEVCGFVYADRYGALGEGFVECHHRIPVSQLEPNQKTTPTDLALVCANCHRMLHRGGELLTVEALRDIVLAGCQFPMEGHGTAQR